MIERRWYQRLSEATAEVFDAWLNRGEDPARLRWALQHRRAAERALNRRIPSLREILGHRD